MSCCSTPLASVITSFFSRCLANNAATNQLPLFDSDDVQCQLVCCSKYTFSTVEIKDSVDGHMEDINSFNVYCSETRTSLTNLGETKADSHSSSPSNSSSTVTHQCTSKVKRRHLFCCHQSTEV